MNDGLSRVILVLITALSPHLADGLPVSARAPLRAKPGVCEREATALVGRRPATIGGTIRAPKKIRDVQPKYPQLPPETTLGGVWMGEFVVNATGKIARVWTIRPLRIRPPFPPFNKSIVDAIQRWEYEPLRVNNEPRPFCVTMTININLQ
jgi:TonB family protein